MFTYLFVYFTIFFSSFSVINILCARAVYVILGLCDGIFIVHWFACFGWDLRFGFNIYRGLFIHFQFQLQQIPNNLPPNTNIARWRLLNNLMCEHNENNNNIPTKCATQYRCDGGLQKRKKASHSNGSRRCFGIRHLLAPNPGKYLLFCFKLLTFFQRV